MISGVVICDEGDFRAFNRKPVKISRSEGVNVEVFQKPTDLVIAAVICRGSEPF